MKDSRRKKCDIHIVSYYFRYQSLALSRCMRYTYRAICKAGNVACACMSPCILCSYNYMYCVRKTAYVLTVEIVGLVVLQHLQAPCRKCIIHVCSYRNMLIHRAYKFKNETPPLFFSVLQFSFQFQQRPRTL